VPFCSNWWSGPMGPVIASLLVSTEQGRQMVPIMVRNLLNLLNLDVMSPSPGLYLSVTDIERSECRKARDA